jgi:membrane protein implicated in regulation of membrane protease activity
VDAVIWIVLAVALVVAEIFTGTFVLIMLGAGALAAALAAAIGASVPFQVVAFAVVSALSLIAVRPVIRRHALRSSPEGSPLGLEAIEGSSGLVLEQVDADHGLVKIEGELWTARSYDATQTIEPGQRVRVIEVKGATAMVWRDELTNPNIPASGGE